MNKLNKEQRKWYELQKNRFCEFETTNFTK